MPSNTNILPSTKYPNNTRTITTGTTNVTDSDVTLLCDTSTGAITIELALIPENEWSTQYKLYVTDIGNNADTYNITINAPSGHTINGDPSYVISESGQSIQLFISSNTNYGISNAVNSPVTNQISDEPFGVTWDGVTDIGASKNAIYDKIITIGAGFGNTAFVRTSGNDTTAIVGNYLMPFLTIGAAVTALGSTTGSALYVDAGTYNLNDSNAPFGLKSPLSNYDVFLAVGCTINYSGTYGLWIINGSNRGSLYGSGNIVNNSSSISSGYVFDLQSASTAGIYTIQASTITNLATSGINALINVEQCNSPITSYIVEINNRAISTGGTNSVTVRLGTNSRATITGNGTYDSGGNNEGGSSTNDNYAISIISPTTVTLKGITITSRGNAFSNINTRCISISNTLNGIIVFDNCTIYPISANGATYKVIDFLMAGAISMTNCSFRNCIIKSRRDSGYSANGLSLFADYNLDIKLINTYAERATGGLGTITNLCSVLDAAGSGFLVEPNL